MILKKNRERQAAARRHRQLMDAAKHVVGLRVLNGQTEHGDPAEVVALAFGRHGLRIDDTEALDYLNAVHAERGYPLLTTDATAPEASE